MRRTVPATFIDTNIPIYAGGGEHRLRQPSLDVLRLAALNRAAFVTSAEVLQELIHRYVAIRAWGRGREVFEGFVDLMSGRTESIHASDVERAARLVDAYPRLGGRDLIHFAVMQRLGVERIITADAGFDRVSEVERLDPARIAEWRDSI